MIEFIIFWVVCSVAAYYLAVYNWTKDHDYTKAEVPMFLFISALGPLGLGAIVGVFLGDYLNSMEWSDDVIKPRRK